jgi:hypothetical protein
MEYMVFNRKIVEQYLAIVGDENPMKIPFQQLIVPERYTHESDFRHLQLLNTVGDENPIHEYIVPGQLIVEKVFSMMDDQWASYKQ